MPSFENFAVLSFMDQSIKFSSLCGNIWRRLISSVTAMGIIDVQSMELVHTSQITLSKFCWHASYRVGAQGEQCPHSRTTVSLICCSIDVMLNGTIWMTTLQDGALTN